MQIIYRFAFWIILCYWKKKWTRCQSFVLSFYPLSLVQSSPNGMLPAKHLFKQEGLARKRRVWPCKSNALYLHFTKWKLHHEKVEDFKSPIVFMSVDYRLAPEYPFPFTIIDGQSATSFLAEHFSSRALHVAGASAGGNSSSVVGLESHRKYPDKFHSIVADIPMFPTIGYRSHHLNSKSSGVMAVVSVLTVEH